ncbi:hypothetical protein FPOAC2_05097 [Fusarium poae]
MQTRRSARIASKSVPAAVPPETPASTRKRDVSGSTKATRATQLLEKQEQLLETPTTAKKLRLEGVGLGDHEAPLGGEAVPLGGDHSLDAPFGGEAVPLGGDHFGNAPLGGDATRIGNGDYDNDFARIGNGDYDYDFARLGDEVDWEWGPREGEATRRDAEEARPRYEFGSRHQDEQIRRDADEARRAEEEAELRLEDEEIRRDAEEKARRQEDEDGEYEYEYEEEDFEGDDVDHFPLDEDEVPPEEEQEQDKEEKEEDSENENEKKETAKELIRRLNEEYPVDENDYDKKKFRDDFSQMIRTLCAWAKDSTILAINAWMSLNSTDREMTRPFRGILIHADCEQLIEDLLEHMPDKVQQVLGRPNLQPIDLLDLPEVPKRFEHRLVYTNVPVDVGVDNVVQAQSQLMTNYHLVKTLKPGTTIKSKMDIRAYVGSSINKKGGYLRLRDHERNSNTGTKEKSKQYTFTRQGSVICNFRLVAAFSQPIDPNHDLDRYMSVFCEGLIIAYLGLLDRSSRPNVDSSLCLFSDAKYNCINQLRESLDLPALHQHSLNSAWPLAQGVCGGMRVQKECGHCKRSNLTASGNKINFVTVGDIRVCAACYKYHRKHGHHRTVIVTNTIHDKRLGPRTCVNPSCGKIEGNCKKTAWVADKDDKGKIKWRCCSCAQYLKHHPGTEWSPTVSNHYNPLLEGPRACGNPNCDRVADPGQKGWYRDKDDRDIWICGRCYAHRRAKPGTEWKATATTKFDPRKALRTCCNLNCGRVEDRTKNERWTKDKDDINKYRCYRCYTYFYRTSREWQQREPRSCLNPECDRVEDLERKDNCDMYPLPLQEPSPLAFTRKSTP